jgi:anti-sigma regulatory factor (Ser/Thr protein kinase)
MMGFIAANLKLSLAPTPAAPTRARGAVSQWLLDHRSDRVRVEVALLLVTELVTNSLRHARIAAGDALVLNGRVDDAILRLELWDAGTDGTVARRTRVRDDEIGGFGLDLVAQLSSAWGVERDADGTTVWLELAAPPPVSAVAPRA